MRNRPHTPAEMGTQDVLRFESWVRDTATLRDLIRTVERRLWIDPTREHQDKYGCWYFRVRHCDLPGLKKLIAEQIHHLGGEFAYTMGTPTGEIIGAVYKSTDGITFSVHFPKTKGGIPC